MYYPLSKQRIDAQIPEKGRSWTETSKFCNCSVTRGLLGKGGDAFVVRPRIFINFSC